MTGAERMKRWRAANADRNREQSAKHMRRMRARDKRLRDLADLQTIATDDAPEGRE